MTTRGGDGNPIDEDEAICGQLETLDVDDVLDFIDREKRAIPPRSEDYEAGLKAVEDYIWEQR